MVVFVWILIAICIIAAIGLTIYFAHEHKEFELSSYNPHTAIKIVITWLVSVFICSILIWALYFTESGKRAQKTMHSEVSGGLNRRVKVYDMQGELIAEYKGKFDVAESATEGITKVKFDCDGKRHIIYGSTGTIIIDEE